VGVQRKLEWCVWLISDRDEYCPHCDNHFVLDAKIPKASIQVEGEDMRVDARYEVWLQRIAVRLMISRMIKDERERQEEMRSIFDVKEAPHKLG
jgi:hypothetical protein